MTLHSEIAEIIEKIDAEIPITVHQAVTLYDKAPVSLLGKIAHEIKLKRHGKNVYYNRNIHLEPTNICIMQCAFCTYYRQKESSEAWIHDKKSIEQLLTKYLNANITEVHIVSGVHPDYGLKQYADIIVQVRQFFPHVHIKAYTAVEIIHIAKREKMSVKSVLQHLQDKGLNSLPGGGAEIFNEKVRQQICPKKATATEWLDVHQTAHELGLKTNATILYGHIETIQQRFEHLDLLRQLQQKTSGFNAFIPLKYKIAGKSGLVNQETSMIDDLKMVALSRIFLHNIDHIKSYWPMFGKDFSQITLQYGVDDMDGTIQDTTKIYTMSGVKSDNVTLTVEQMQRLITEANSIPVERDSHYHIVQREDS